MKSLRWNVDLHFKWEAHTQTYHTSHTFLQHYEVNCAMQPLPCTVWPVTDVTIRWLRIVCRRNLIDWELNVSLKHSTRVWLTDWGTFICNMDIEEVSGLSAFPIARFLQSANVDPKCQSSTNCLSAKCRDTSHVYTITTKAHQNLGFVQQNFKGSLFQ